MEAKFVRIKMVLGYDGSAFHGFAYQNETLPTVALRLRQCLAKLFRFEPEITCAGRTDAGVHAWGQVVHFDVPITQFDSIGTQRIQKSLNRQLNPQIVIRSVDVVDADFHARFSATGRRYRYTVHNSSLVNPFTVNIAWWVPQPLDIEKMNAAAKAIIGEHDYSSFCRRPDQSASMTRNVRSAEWKRLADQTLRFDIEANAFCHQMVRALTGMLVSIGRGKREVAEMQEVLNAQDRSKAEALAAPQGLCLWEVLY